MKLAIDERLQENFTMNEFLDAQDAVAIGTAQAIRVTKMSYLAQETRKMLGRIRVTSGYRSTKFNITVGGTKDSYHPEAQAMDFELITDKGIEDWGTWTPETLFAAFDYIGWHNAGVYVDKYDHSRILFCHVDVGPKRKDGYYDWKDYSDTMSHHIVYR